MLDQNAVRLNLSPKLRAFSEAALPYNYWGRAYVETRIMELMTMDGMLPGVLRGSDQRALDIGCGIGLACAWLSERFAHVDGTDIETRDTAFESDRPYPLVGRELAEGARIDNVSFHCGDTFDFLDGRPETYDLILSVFVMEHVKDIDRLCEGVCASLKPGGRTLHIVPNTHDTIVQLLTKNLSPVWQNVKQALRMWGRKDRAEGRLFGTMFAPITHSEFLSDYRDQFEINALERYTFPMIRAGLIIRDIKPVREHAFAVLAQKPDA